MPDEPRNRQSFGSTITSMIVGAAQWNEQRRREELERFIACYGAPLRAHLVYRRRVPEDLADDWLNDFFVDKLLVADPQQSLAWKYLEKKSGSPTLKFRSYLLTALNHYVIDKVRRQRHDQISLDAHDLEPVDDSPGVHDRFDMDWANNLLHQALAAVQADCESHGQADIWRVFDLRVVRPARLGTPPPSYDMLVTELGFRSPKQASNRLQTAVRKFNRVVRELIVDYLPTTDGQSLEATIEQELQDLRRVLSATGALRLADGEQRVDEGTLSSISPTLYDIDSTADGLWSASDLQQMWQHLLKMPVDDVLWESSRHLAEKYADITVLAGAPLRSLEDLWRHPAPPLDLLQAIKNEAKASGRHTETVISRNWASDCPTLRHSIPSEINAVLYLASIAAAWLRLGTRITRDADSKFKPRLDVAVSMPWLDPVTAALFSEWRTRIEAEQ